MALKLIEDPKRHLGERPFYDSPVNAFLFDPDRKQLDLVVTLWEPRKEPSATYAHYRFCGVGEVTQTGHWKPDGTFRSPGEIHSSYLATGRTQYLECDARAGTVGITFERMYFEDCVCKITRDSKGRYYHVDIATNKTVTGDHPFDLTEECPDSE